MDVWKAFRPKASEREQVYVGYSVVVALVIISIAWLPILHAFQGAQLFMYIQAVSNYFQPPFTVLFSDLDFLDPPPRYRGAFHRPPGLASLWAVHVLLLELIYSLALDEAPQKV